MDEDIGILKKKKHPKYRARSVKLYQDVQIVMNTM